MWRRGSFIVPGSTKEAVEAESRSGDYAGESGAKQLWNAVLKPSIDKLVTEIIEHDIPYCPPYDAAFLQASYCVLRWAFKDIVFLFLISQYLNSINQSSTYRKKMNEQQKKIER